MLPSPTVTQEWRTQLERAWRCLERWEATPARDAVERARALAAGWGEARGIALADVLLGRITLLSGGDPRVHPSRPSVGDTTDRELAAAVLRFDAEIAAAFGATSSALPEIPSLEDDSPVDAIAAAAIVGSLRLADGARKPRRIPGAGAIARRDDASGWHDLVAALDIEADGGSGMVAVDRALVAGDREQHRALLWTALGIRALLCERRGARSEARATRERMRALMETWAIGLPASEAIAALARPDRAAISGAEASGAPGGAVASRMVDIALALGQERDVARLIDLALDAALAVTGAERGILLLRDPQAGYRVAAHRHVGAGAKGGPLVELSSTVARLALESDEVVLANEVRSDPRLSERASIALDVTSLLCAPIHARGERQGAIYLDRRAKGQPFDEPSVSAARAIGSMLASALLGARVIADLEARSRDLEVARDELAVALAQRTVERDDMSRRLADLRDVVPAGAESLVGRAPAMRRLGQIIANVAASDAPVLINGETGSGKELVARAIHAASARRDRPFVALNCGALSETLLAAELFGAERGAYTGATTSRPGLFVAADGGTLLLDEVGDMPPAMQTTLLRVLETSEIRPVGATRSHKVDVRIVAASHRDLLELVRRGSFRDDLRYRLEVVRIEVPPLRDRIEDLPELCQHLLEDVRRRYNLPARPLSPEALQVLRQRRWPGNVRELRHVLASASLAATGASILPEHLPPERAAEGAPADPATVDLRPTDGHAVRIGTIRSALRATAGHRGRAAKMLGISRSTLYRYLQAGGEPDADPEAAED